MYSALWHLQLDQQDYTIFCANWYICGEVGVQSFVTPLRNFDQKIPLSSPLAEGEIHRGRISITSSTNHGRSTERHTAALLCGTRRQFSCSCGFSNARICWRKKTEQETQGGPLNPLWHFYLCVSCVVPFCGMRFH